MASGSGSGMVAGHHGALRMKLADPDELRKGLLPPDVSITSWRLVTQRQMRDVTPPDLDTKEWWPHHGQAFVQFMGWITSGQIPGTFNLGGPIHATLYPDKAEEGKNWQGNVWVRNLEALVAVDMPNRVRGELIFDAELFLNWS